MKKDAVDLLKKEMVGKKTIIAIKLFLLVGDIVISVFLEKKRKDLSNSGLPPLKNNGLNGNRNNE
jgi:hypothetical protein